MRAVPNGVFSCEARAPIVRVPSPWNSVGTLDRLIADAISRGRTYEALAIERGRDALLRELEEDVDEDDALEVDGVCTCGCGLSRAERR